MTNAAQEAWIATAMGRATDPDGVGGLQCVDTAKDYFEHIFGVGWKNGWPGAGNAKDMLYTFNPDYFDRTLNDSEDEGQIPQRGDIIIWSGTAANGVNPYGHIAVVVDADANGVDVIQQDGFLQVPMFAGRLAYTNYGTGPCSGWLRPKVSADAAVSPQSSNVTPIPQQEEDIMASIDDLKAALKSDDVLEEIARRVHTRPLPYLDPQTGKDTGQPTTVAALVGGADFRFIQTVNAVSGAAKAIVDAVKAAQPQDAAQVAQAAYDEFLSKLKSTSLTIGASNG
jgi:hypothetical protein